MGLIIFILIVLAIIFVFFLLGKGFEQKYGRFDMPPGQLDKVIYEFIPNEDIKDSDLPFLREKLYELGFTDLSEGEIIIQLKQILQENNNWN